MPQQTTTCNYEMIRTSCKSEFVWICSIWWLPVLLAPFFWSVSMVRQLFCAWSAAFAAPVPRSRHQTGPQIGSSAVANCCFVTETLAVLWHIIKLQCRLTLFDICKFSSLEKFRYVPILCLIDVLLENDYSFLPGSTKINAFMERTPGSWSLWDG